jgi:hypothetical protein
MTDAMTIRAQNETLAELSQDRLCRSAASDGLRQTETFGLPVMEVEDSPILQTANPTTGLFL